MMQRQIQCLGHAWMHDLPVMYIQAVGEMGVAFDGVIPTSLSEFNDVG